MVRPARRHPVRWALLAVVSLTTAASVSGCGTDPALETLQADPLSTLTPAHTTLLDEHTQESGTSPLGKPHYAGVTRVFAVEAGTSPEQVVAGIARTAAGTGWRGRFRRSGSVRHAAWIAERRTEDLRLSLLVTVNTLDVTEGDLFVYLRAYPR